MKKYFENLANALLGMPYRDLSDAEQHVIESIAESESIVENVNHLFHEQLTFGQRVADKISSFGGSWPFIIIFISLMVIWMVINTVWLIRPGEPFDPYPFILLNLVLSTLAALQAPIIMMSQNRQTSKDRMAITENYKVSLKTDLEIMRLHQKIDGLSEQLASVEEINKGA